MSLAVDLKRHGAVQIDVERLVSDPHRTATQLDWFTVFARHQFIVPKSMQQLFQWRFDRYPRKQRLAGLNPASKSLAKHADQKTRYRNSGRCVGAPLLIHLTVFQLQSEPQATPRTEREG
jgi:hypothetical protein